MHQLATTLSPLRDQFGRVATDLRVSLTDRCNLRCSYCMPAEGLDWLPRDDILTDDEVVRLIEVAVTRLGVDEVRFTGGEPLIRPGFVGHRRAYGDAQPAAADVRDHQRDRAGADGRGARDAGLDRVNVSLDTVRAETFATITRRDRLDDVIRGLAAAADAGLTPVKVNAVLLRGQNDDQAGELLALVSRARLRAALHRADAPGRPARLEPGRDGHGRRDPGLAGARLRAHAGPGHRGSAPAELFLVDGGPATVGIIASVTRPFCGDCDRVRLTADGQVRNCLFAREESDLRTALRGGASDDEIAERWRAAMWTKRPGHGIDDPSFLQPARPMSAIGG